MEILSNFKKTSYDHVRDEGLRWRSEEKSL